MDTRGQGSNGWSAGDTPDPDAGSGPQTPGFMTNGIGDPKRYYYRRVFTDAVRAVEVARAHPAVDPERVAVGGGSQGGGITLAVAGLVDRLAAVMPDVPFLSHYRRATEITDSHPYAEIATYCKTHRDQIEQVFTTLSYFDAVNFAPRATAPALFSVGLMDAICPPSTVYAAYNHYAAAKEIEVWPYNGHEGGAAFQRAAQLRFLARAFDTKPEESSPQDGLAGIGYERPPKVTRMVGGVTGLGCHRHRQPGGPVAGTADVLAGHHETPARVDEADPLPGPAAGDQQRGHVRPRVVVQAQKRWAAAGVAGHRLDDLGRLGELLGCVDDGGRPDHEREPAGQRTSGATSRAGPSGGARPRRPGRRRGRSG